MTAYHPGERAVQVRAGVRAEADRLAPLIRDEISEAASSFLAEQPMAVIGATDASGRVWATMLTGFPGFLTSSGPSTIEIAAAPLPGDPLHELLEAPTQVGLIVIEPGSRRRVRMNGTALPTPQGLHVDLAQVYPNCPKYIQRREPTWVPATPGMPQRSGELTREQVGFVASTDTFFVATTDGEGNADASHRGGNPGFVQVVGPTHLRWPDYPGNSMFNTAGNLEVNPRAGLLLPDWHTGAMLHLTGTAAVDWDPEHAAAVPGAQRLVDFRIEQVVHIGSVSPLRWSEPEPSRFNPPSETPEGTLGS